MPLLQPLLLKMGLRSSHCTRTRPRSPLWAVTAPAASRTPGYEHSCCKGKSPTQPLLPPQRLGRRWTGGGLPYHALARMAAVTLATTAHVPSVYTSFGCQDSSWGWESDGGIVWGWGMGQQCPKHFEGGLRPGPQRPARLHMASDTLVLCPEPFHYGIRGSVSTPHQFPSSLMTSVPDPRTDPSLCPGKSVSSYSGQGEGCGAYSVTCWTAPLSPVCVIIFLKLVLPVVATPCPSLGSSLSSRPVCTSLGCSRVPGLCSNPACQAQPAKARTQQPAQRTCLWRERRGLLCRKFEPIALGKGTLHDIPLPTLHQVEGPVFPDMLTPFNVPNGPSPCARPPPPPQSEHLLPRPAVCLSILCALCSDSPGQATSNPL